MSGVAKYYEDLSRLPQSGAAMSDTGDCKISSLTQDPVSLIFPMGPSVNDAYKNTKWGRSKTKAYKEWEEVAKTAIKNQVRELKLKTMTGRFLLVYGFERNSLLADVGNYEKLPTDALVSCKVIEDDRFVTGQAVVWMPYVTGQCHLKIIPIEGNETISLTLHASENAETGSFIVNR